MVDWMRPACQGLQGNRAIALRVLCGLLVSLVVTALFVLSLAAALLLFLREIFIATAALTFGGTRVASSNVAKQGQCPTKSVRSGHSATYRPIP